jgi:sporulation protein YlmC with PRC-barrel domain
MTQHNNVQVLSATTLIGDNVRNLQGEDLGTLEEIMVDLDTGQVAYAVLSFGGLLGLGNKLFAIPWQALTVDTENEEIVLGVSKEKLENAPGFDHNNWPQTLNRDWVAEVYDHYGYKPYWN